MNQAIESADEGLCDGVASTADMGDGEFIESTFDGQRLRREQLPMTDEPKVCIDPQLTLDQRFEAARLAVEENPENVPAAVVRPGLGVGPATPVELALIAAKKWNNGRSLRVGFVDGTPQVQAKVQQIAQEWTQYANLKLEFGDLSTAEIRISFAQRGSWSYIGTDALAIPRNQPTMNYGWLTPDTPDDEYGRVVRHEFGHALGCIHEHQNPSGNIPWDSEAVYRYYMGPPNNWTKDQVDTNLFRKYGRDVTNFSAFDRQSIMLYPIPNAHTIGDYEVGMNDNFSETDKSFIATMYPSAPKPGVEVAVGEAPVSASIGSHGEIDLYRFNIATSGDYEVKTGGATDVVMTLLGPDDETTIVGVDDDSGVGLNALIRARLDPGTYSVRIRHYRPSGRGKYELSVAATSQSG